MSYVWVNCPLSPWHSWARNWNSNHLETIVSVLVFQLCPTVCDPITVARQVPLSMEFSRQEYWSGLPFPPLGDLPNSGTEPASLVSPALAGRVFTISAPWEDLGASWCHIKSYHRSTNKLELVLPLTVRICGWRMGNATQLLIYFTEDLIHGLGIHGRTRKRFCFHLEYNASIT